MGIKERLVELKSSLPKAVTLVAVSKTKPVTDLMQAYDAGQRIFGENKVQEMAEKYQQMPKDIQWHMIGHLQRNKVKQIASFVEMIHSVDSLRLLKEIDKQAERCGRMLKVLLQVHIADEESKFGFDRNELIQLVKSGACSNFDHVSICGLMGMATFTDDEDQVKSEFKSLQELKEGLKPLMPDPEQFTELSIGMSQDCHIAVKCGSTMVRVGSRLFR